MTTIPRSGEALTTRETAIAELVATGRRTKDVAAELGLSVRTVESHLASIYRKLGLSGRAELASRMRTPSGEAAPPCPELPMPPTRYARTGEVSIAYQVAGDGPVDVVVTPGIASHLEMQWEQPQWRRFVSRLADVGRVIMFDKRGTGLSDPIPSNHPQSLDERIGDILAVMDAVGSGRALLFGISEGGPMSLYFAAAHPERVAALLLYGASIVRPPDAVERRQQLLSLIEAAHGTGLVAARMWPSLSKTAEDRAWLARFERFAVSPGMLRAIMTANIDIDASAILPAVRVPVTIVHGVNDPTVPLAEGRAVMELVPHARFVPIDVVDHVPWGEVDLEAIVDELRSLMLSADWQHEPAGVLLTVLAVHAGTDPTTAARVRNGIGGGRGRIVDERDGSFLAEFDGVGAAVRCAVMTSGLDPMVIRAGVSIGEVRRRGGRLTGPPVDEAEALAREAGPGQVRVARSVRSLIAEAHASDLHFVDGDGPAIEVRLGGDRADQP